MVTRILCSPYSKNEPWKVAATLYNGTIYLSEIETEEAKQRTATENPRMKEMSYWGVKFEDYVTDPGNIISISDVASQMAGNVTYFLLAQPFTINIVCLLPGT